MHRIRRRIAIVVGLISLMGISCRWFDVMPDLSVMWGVIVLLATLLAIMIDRRYQTLYRHYVVMIIIAMRLGLLWVGRVADLSLEVILLYIVLMSNILVSWMLRPIRRWAIPLLAMVGAGGLMLIPRSPKPISPTTIVDRMPHIQLYRERISDDESVNVIHSGVSTKPRPGQRVLFDDDTITIEYASAQPNHNILTIYTNTLTTIHMGSQSALSLSYHDGAWSGSAQGFVSWYGSDGVKWTGDKVPFDSGLNRSHQDLLLQAQRLVDDIRPSSLTQTRLGAMLLRTKFVVLGRLDSSYHDDLTQLYQYQCLVYMTRCSHLSPERAHHSLGMKERDHDLQSTLSLGGQETLSLWHQILDIIQ